MSKPKNYLKTMKAKLKKEFLVENKKQIITFASIGLLLVSILSWFLIQVPIEKQSFNQAFPSESISDLIPDCSIISPLIKDSVDIEATKILTEEASNLTESSDPEAWVAENGITTWSSAQSDYNSKIDQMVKTALDQLILKHHENYIPRATQYNNWLTDFKTLAIRNCGLTADYETTNELLVDLDKSLNSAKTLANAEAKKGAEVRSVFPDYPKLVSIGSVNSNVAGWIEWDSGPGVNELVALAPGVYAVYNRGLPNKNDYYVTDVPLYGDCGVINKYFVPNSYSCGSVLPGTEE